MLSMILAITTQLANLFFKFYKAPYPLLLHSVHNIIQLTLQLDKFSLLPDETQEINATLVKAGRLDIELLIAVLVSLDQDRDDNATLMILQYIETHFSLVSSHQLLLDACRLNFVNLRQARTVHWLGKLATSTNTSSSHLHLSLLQWLCRDISATFERFQRHRNRVHQCMLKVLLQTTFPAWLTPSIIRMILSN